MKNLIFPSLFLVVFSLSCDSSMSSPEVDCSSCSTSILGYEVVVKETPLDNSTIKQLRVDCPEGKRVLSSGWSALDETSAILDGISTYSEPSFDGKHWMVNAKNTSSFAPEWKLRMRCICATVSSD